MEFEFVNDGLKFLVDLFELAVTEFADFYLVENLIVNLYNVDDFVIQLCFV